VLRVLQSERGEWVRRLVEGETLVQSRESVETAHAVGVIRGLDGILTGIEEQLRLQWDEAQEILNAERMEKEV